MSLSFIAWVPAGGGGLAPRRRDHRGRCLVGCMCELLAAPGAITLVRGGQRCSGQAPGVPIVGGRGVFVAGCVLWPDSTAAAAEGAAIGQCRPSLAVRSRLVRTSAEG
jgi:hypothetical protein